jgi:hypothetical protein
MAQDITDDWEIIRQPEQKTVFAFVPMTTGLTIAFRCVDGNFGSVIAGLPQARRQERTRTLRIKVGEEEFSDTRWNVTTDRSVAIADYPAPLARELRAGGGPSPAAGRRVARGDATSVMSWCCPPPVPRSTRPCRPAGGPWSTHAMPFCPKSRKAV